MCHAHHIQNVYSLYNFESCTYNRSRDIHKYISNKRKYGKMYFYQKPKNSIFILKTFVIYRWKEDKKLLKNLKELTL